MSYRGIHIQRGDKRWYVYEDVPEYVVKSGEIEWWNTFKSVGADSISSIKYIDTSVPLRDNLVPLHDNSHRNRTVPRAKRVSRLNDKGHSPSKKWRYGNPQ